MDMLVIVDEALIVFLKIIIGALLLGWVILLAMISIDIWVQAWRVFWGIK